jgi:DNA-binding transcriptional LysR family regulator
VTLQGWNRRQVQLTDQGRTFLDHARTAVRSAKDAPGQGRIHAGAGQEEGRPLAPPSKSAGHRQSAAAQKLRSRPVVRWVDS